MNKRLLTLCASICLMLVCSLSVKAQFSDEDAPITDEVTAADNPYPSRLVRANKNVAFTPINKIDSDKWYQIVIESERADKPGLRAVKETYLLTMQRNRETGDLVLVAKSFETAKLNESLWQVKVTKVGTAGYTYQLINKASGYMLSFNDGFTNVQEDGAEEKMLNPSMSSDLSEWQWYTDPDVSGTGSTLGLTPFYAYNHTGNAVFGLVGMKNEEERTLELTSDMVISAWKVNKEDFQDRDAGGEFLQLQLVEAGPRVLNADEINTMIDASNGGKSAILKSIPTVDNELFGQNITAVTVNANALGDKYKGFANFLRNDNGNYLRVDPDSTYDYGTLPITNGGLKVDFAKLQSVDMPGSIGASAKDTTVEGINAKGTLADALIARYLWRVTYYPTPDSLVLEPLNASQVSTYDKQQGRTWVHSMTATASMNQFFNTVNEGFAYDNNGIDGPEHNNNFKKSPFAAVALTLYNRGNGSYDQAPVLTVGCALNVVQYANPETPEETAITGATYNKTTGTAAMGIKISFDRKDNYLTRTTVPNGLYFIQLQSKANNDLFRKAGKYYVDNHRGTMMYDSPTSYQNYNHMPATQWVVLQDTCHVEGGTPWVTIFNREYGNLFFLGQLYIDSNKNYYILNKHFGSEADGKGMFSKLTEALGKPGLRKGGLRDGGLEVLPGIGYKDTISFTPVKDPTAYLAANGYQHIDSLASLYSEYNLKYLTANLYNETTTDQYLNIAKDSILSINENPGLAFQFESIGKPSVYGPIFMDSTAFHTAYGTIEPLTRQAYILKVRDNNLIDNGWKYVAFHQDVVNQNPYYKMENLKNIDGQTNKLAVFYLKNDQFTADSTDAFALIDVVGLDSIYMSKKDKNIIKPIATNFKNTSMSEFLTKVEEMTHYRNPADAFDYSLIYSLEFTYYNNGSVIEYIENNIDFENMNSMHNTYAANGWYRLAVEDQNAMSTIATLDNEPSTRVSAFVLSPIARELYMPLKDKGVLSGKNIKIYRERGINGATEEFLYEDGNNAANVAETSYIKGFNYLGITGENIAPVGKDKTVAFYVDSVLHSQKVMPQYLLYVDRDTIAEGKWCNTGEHGYNHEGDSQTHQIVYNALSYGRVLVNLNDSVKLYDGTSNNMLENGLKYGFENYVRLGFVPAIHINIGEKDDSSAFAQFMKPGEWLIVLKGTTFDALKSKVAGSENIIDPVAVDSAKAKGLVDFMPLDGNHQNYAFSFRYTDDAHENFLMESQGYLPWAYPGCFWEASWVKIQNNVPVLAQCINPWNGEHTQIYGMDELKETINQSQIFKLKTTDEIATANESLAAANVQVIAGNGVVTVKNAAGKKLVITNILGKVIANTVVTSDNATFAAPAGIVAVAVEGEPAVKAIVK